MTEKAPYLKMGVKSGIYNPAVIAEIYNKFAMGGAIIDDNNDDIPEEKSKNGIPYKVDERGNVIYNKYTHKPTLDYTKASWYEPWMGSRGAFYNIHPELIEKDRPRFTTELAEKKVAAQKEYEERLAKSSKPDKVSEFVQTVIDEVSNNQQGLINALGRGYKEASNEEYQRRKEAIYPYKLMANSLATAAELGSAYYMLGKGAKALNLLPNNRIINRLYQSDKGQVIASSLGTAADTYQLLTADTTRDVIENSIELPADVAGIVGGTNWFRNTPLFGRYGKKIDKTLDFIGYTIAGYDGIVKPINWMWNNFNTSNTE